MSGISDHGVVADEEVLRSLLRSDDDSPFVMVNLMKVRDQDELDSYSRMVLPLITKHGGSYVHGGPVGGHVVGESEWDFVALVRYPSRRAFAEMMLSEEYARAVAHRIAGVERAEAFTTPG